MQTVIWNWKFHSEIVWVNQDIFWDWLIKITFQVSKSSRNSQKLIEKPKTYVEEKCSKTHELFWMTFIMEKKSYIFSFWMPGTGYFPNEILKNRSLWFMMYYGPASKPFVFFWRTIVQQYDINSVLLLTFQPIKIKRGSQNCQAVLSLVKLFAEGKKSLLLSYNGAPESRKKTRWSRL